MRSRLIAGILLSLALCVTLLGQSAQEMYQRGLVQERAAGNLEEAIKFYSLAAESAGKDRELAAKAWIRIAASQEKLGKDTEAADAYAEVLQTYPEQREQAALAQDRLVELLKIIVTTSLPKQKSGLTDVSAVTNSIFESYSI